MRRGPFRIQCLRAALLVAAALPTCCAMVRAQCPPGPLFSPPAGYATGSLPSYLAAGDFNGDAVLDIAVANSGLDANTISILLGNGTPGAGDGTFRPGGTFDAGGLALGLAAGEFTGDAFRDLVVANGTSSTISVLAGVGDGTFAAPASHAVGSNPENLAVGDFNGDGLQDVVVADRDTRGIYVLLGQGVGGGFVEGFSSILVYAPLRITAADLSGDGILDLAFIASFGKLGVMLGAGAGGLGDGAFAMPTYYPGGMSPSALAVLDFNLDGMPDVVVANRARGGMNAFSGIGGGALASSGTFAPGLTLTTVAATQVDDDAIPDLLTTTSPENQLLFLKGSGAGSGFFGSPSVEAVLAPGPRDLLVGFFNPGCAMDVAAVSTNGTVNPPTRLSILIGQCVPCEDAPTSFTATDRTGDQGGFVRLTWHRSALDGPHGGAVTSYQIWRQTLVPGGEPAGVAPVVAAGAHPLDRAAAHHEISGGWVHVRDVPAVGVFLYVADAPTTRDSTSDDNAPHAFYVRAVTNGDAFYDSGTLVSHSVDNLAPPAPPYILAEATPTGPVWLRWGPSDASDVAEYRVHRGWTTTFVPGPNNLIAVVADTQYVDPVGSATSVYKVAAVDIHGNIGPTAGGETILCSPPECSINSRFHPTLSRFLQATAFDSTFGHFRAAYDLPRGWFTAAVSGHEGEYVRLTTNDLYWIEGGTSDQSFTFNAYLQIGSQSSRICGFHHCTQGYVQASITEVGGPSGPCPGSTEPCVVVTRRGYEPFKLSVSALAGVGGSLDASGWATIQASLRISGLPPGAYVVSCSGYISDKSVPVQLSLVDARVAEGVARITWHTPDGSATSATVYRRSGDDDWSIQGGIVADGSGLLVYEDRTVIAGRRYGYRLGVPDGGEERLLGETWVEVPILARLALEDIAPNPAIGPIQARFSLPAARPARLELFDVSGRLLQAREVGALGGGSHTLVLEESGPLRPGIYMLRLSQDGARVTKRVVKIR